MLQRRLGRLAILGALLSSACATNRVSEQQLAAERAEAPTVTVRNNNWLDVTIYAVHGTSRLRVGTVSGSSTQTFRLTGDAAHGTAPLQILADPIGSSSTYITDPVTLSRGQRLELQVGSSMSISTFAVVND